MYIILIQQSLRDDLRKAIMEIDKYNTLCDKQNQEFMEVSSQLIEVEKSFKDVSNQNTLLRDSVRDGYRLEAQNAEKGRLITHHTHI